MNAAYIAIGGGLVAVGAAMIAAGKKSGDPVKAKNGRLSGILMMAAGVIFMATSLFVGRSS